MRHIALFCGRVGLLYLLLVLPWPGLEQTYARMFRGIGAILCQPFTPRATLRFYPRSVTGTLVDTEIVLSKPPSRQTGRMLVESRTIGYLPTAFLTALVLATLQPWPGRLRNLAWGYLLVHVFIVARLGIPLMILASEGSPNLYSIGPRGRGVLHALEQAIAINSSSSFVVPMLIWLGLAIPGGLMGPLLKQRAAQGRRTPSPGSG